MSRLSVLPTDGMDDAQRALYSSIIGGPRASGPQHFALSDESGRLNGPFDVFLRAPDLGEALQRVGAAVRYRTSLSDRVREAAILLVATTWDSAFERYAHEAVGAASGLTAPDLAQLRAGRTPSSATAPERVRLDFVRALLLGDVSDEEWARAAADVGERELVELTTLVGYYATLALQLRVFRIETPAAPA